MSVKLINLIEARTAEAVVATVGSLNRNDVLPLPVIQDQVKGPQLLTAFSAAAVARLSGFEYDVVEPVRDCVRVLTLVALAIVCHACRLLNDDPVGPVELVNPDR